MRIVALALLSLCLASPSALAAVRTIDIEVGTYPDGRMYLEPSNITVQLHDDVTLAVKNVDRIFHDVALLDYNGTDEEIEVPAGRTVSHRFFASVPGDFRLICEVSGHKQKGMFGYLHVEEPRSGIPGIELFALLGMVGIVALARRKVT